MLIAAFFARISRFFELPAAFPAPNPATADPADNSSIEDASPETSFCFPFPLVIDWVSTGPIYAAAGIPSNPDGSSIECASAADAGGVDRAVEDVICRTDT